MLSPLARGAAGPGAASTRPGRPAERAPEPAAGAEDPPGSGAAVQAPVCPSRGGSQGAITAMTGLKRLVLAGTLMAMTTYTAAYFTASRFQKWSNANRVWNLRTFDSRLPWRAVFPAGMLEMGIWHLLGEDFVVTPLTGGPGVSAPAPAGQGGRPPSP